MNRMPKDHKEYMEKKIQEIETEDYMEKVGSRIRSLREEKEWKQPTLEKKVGVTHQTLSQWENGKKLPRLEYIYKMSILFDCEVGYLLGWYDSPTKEITDIQKATGLTEQAVEILKFVNNGKTEQSKFENPFDYEYFKAFCSTFLDIINVIIESSNADNFWERSGYRTRKAVSENGKRNIFPTNAITDFIAKVRKANEPIDDRELLELEIESGVMENRLKNMSKYEYNAYLIDEWKKPYDRRDIQDAIMEFLKSDYVEKGRNEEG